MPESSTNNEYKFVKHVDNYFTNTQPIAALREKGFGILGTSRSKRSWPPSQLTVAENPNFNDLYYYTDHYDTLKMKWIDNNVLLMVSNLQKPNGFVYRIGRRPRLTATNRQHIQNVWGNYATKMITILCEIDDYKKSIGGVDLADQGIADCSLDVRCHQPLVHLMLQCLGIIRSNAYSAYTHFPNTEKVSQKT